MSSEIDEQIAREVMGWHPSDHSQADAHVWWMEGEVKIMPLASFCPTTSGQDALCVVECLRHLGFFVMIQNCCDDHDKSGGTQCDWCVLVTRKDELDREVEDESLGIYEGRGSFGEAVCRAALLACGRKEAKA